MRYSPYRRPGGRRSIRLKGYDYSRPGAYFVTIVTHHRACLFGEVVEGEMRLNDTGQMVWDVWQVLPNHFAGLKLDAFVVMPNHVHGIIVIVGAGLPCPYAVLGGETTRGGVTPPLRRATLGQIVAYFKYQTTTYINQRRGTPGAPVWQRNYYEHIIRNEDSLHRIRQYIAENPLRWAWDRENPNAEQAVRESAFIGTGSKPAPPAKP